MPEHAQSTLPVNLAALVAFAAGREGTIWSIEASPDLNVNLVRFGVGRGVGDHANDEVDVVFVGVSGTGVVEVDGCEHALEAEKLVFVPKGARCSTRGASEEFAYLTIHGRRGPLRIGANRSQRRQKGGRG